MNVFCFGRDIYGEGFSFYCFIPVSAIIRKAAAFCVVTRTVRGANLPV